MSARRQAPYGAWKSPVSAAIIAGQSVRLQDLCTDGTDIYWTESRPTERGRYALVKCGADGVSVDVSGSADYSMRSLVNAYGGGAFAVESEVVYFVNYRGGGPDPDQRVYRLAEDGSSYPLTPDTQGQVCYADLCVDTGRNRLFAVQQDSTRLNPSGQPTQSLIAVDAREGGTPQTLATGNDFYSSPCLSPDGKQLAWLTWNYPHMPWDGCEVWLADITEEGTLRDARRIAGSDDESIFQPQWSPDGTLYFCSDRDNWWNLYRWNGVAVEQVTAEQAEIGRPQWIFGLSNYAFLSEKEIVCGVCTEGIWKLCRVDVRSGNLTDLCTDWTDVSHIRTAGDAVVCLAGSPTLSRSVVRLDTATGAKEILRASSALPDTLIPYLSLPTTISYPTTGDATAHAFYYPPHNPDFVAPPDEKPPLLILSHGGPTAATSTLLTLPIQYFTSRGIGVVDVNYRGSTGYGRDYRLALYGTWGVMDVEDCANAGRYLVMRGLADGARIAARGGSAGGYITLCLAAFHDLLAVGASYFGISDLIALAEHTHNFEAHYTDVLIGPLPEYREVYKARSALYHAGGIRCPLLFLQGEEDTVVLPAQTLDMVTVLQQNRVPTAFLLFPHEQHGFRIAENICAALEKELEFYSLFLHFTPAPLE
jgi:dipeptidyl aminopeptidase/acylaminoacyl peptidase